MIHAPICQFLAVDETDASNLGSEPVGQDNQRRRASDRNHVPALFPHMRIEDVDGAGIAVECRAIRDNGDLRLYLVEAGELTVATNDVPRRIGPRDLLVVDLRRPLDLQSSGGRIVTATMPADLLSRKAAFGVSLHGLVLGEAQYGLLGDVLRSLARTGTPANRALASMATATVLAVLSAALAAGKGETAVGTPPLEEAKRQRATAYIDTMLHRSDLSVEIIARGIGMSRSALYRLFEPHGGVARHISRRRLVALHRAMNDAGEMRPFSILALDQGFASVSHASRCFKDHFGMTPGEYRSGRPRRGVADTGRERLVHVSRTLRQSIHLGFDNLL